MLKKFPLHAVFALLWGIGGVCLHAKGYATTITSTPSYAVPSTYTPSTVINIPLPSLSSGQIAWKIAAAENNGSLRLILLSAASSNINDGGSLYKYVGTPATLAAGAGSWSAISTPSSMTVCHPSVAEDGTLGVLGGSWGGTNTFWMANNGYDAATPSWSNYTAEAASCRVPAVNGANSGAEIGGVSGVNYLFRNRGLIYEYNWENYLSYGSDGIIFLKKGNVLYKVVKDAGGSQQIIDAGATWGWTLRSFAAANFHQIVMLLSDSSGRMRLLKLIPGRWGTSAGDWVEISLPSGTVPYNGDLPIAVTAAGKVCFITSTNGLACVDTADTANATLPRVTLPASAFINIPFSLPNLPAGHIVWRIAVAETSSKIRLLVVSANPNEFWAGGNAYKFVGTIGQLLSGGGSWQQVSFPSGVTAVSQAVVSEDGVICVKGGRWEAGGTFYCTDIGAYDQSTEGTWTQVNGTTIGRSVGVGNAKSFVWSDTNGNAGYVPAGNGSFTPLNGYTTDWFVARGADGTNLIRNNHLVYKFLDGQTPTQWVNTNDWWGFSYPCISVANANQVVLGAAGSGQFSPGRLLKLIPGKSGTNHTATNSDWVEIVSPSGSIPLQLIPFQQCMAVSGFGKVFFLNSANGLTCIDTGSATLNLSPGSTPYSTQTTSFINGTSVVGMNLGSHVASLAVTKDGMCLLAATGTGKKLVVLIRNSSGSYTKATEVDFSSAAGVLSTNAVAISSDDQLVAIGNRGEQFVRIYTLDKTTGSLSAVVNSPSLSRSSNALAWHPGTQAILLTGGPSQEGGVSLNILQVYRGANNAYTCLERTDLRPPIPAYPTTYASTACNRIQSVSWHPGGNFFAAGFGVWCNWGYPACHIYKIDWTTNTVTKFQDTGGETYATFSTGWNKDGSLFAYSYDGSSGAGYQMGTYGFDASNGLGARVSKLNGTGWGSNKHAMALAWHPNGALLATGFSGSSISYELTGASTSVSDRYAETTLLLSNVASNGLLSQFGIRITLPKAILGLTWTPQGELVIGLGKTYGALNATNSPPDLALPSNGDWTANDASLYVISGLVPGFSYSAPTLKPLVFGIDPSYGKSQLDTALADATTKVTAFEQAVSAANASLSQSTVILDVINSLVASPIRPLSRLIYARYGAGTVWVDVLGKMQALLGTGNSYTFQAGVMNNIFGDPAPGTVKNLVYGIFDTTTYQVTEATIIENAGGTCKLP